MSSELLNPTVSATKRFGVLKLYATPVTLTKGASYTIPGILNFDKTGDREWNGKAKATNSNLRHVVLSLSQKSKEGEVYQRIKDYLTSDKHYKKAIFPTVTANDMNVDTEYFACIEETESGRFYQEKPVMDWSIAAIYKTEAEMLKASEEHFAQFANNSAVEAAALDIPEPYTAEQWQPFAAQFDMDCAAIMQVPAPLREKAKADLATKWGVTPAYVESHVIPI